MLGLKIKAYMDGKYIKQTVLTDKTGMRPQVVSAILAGTRKIEATEYFAICQALEVPLDFFFKEEKNTCSTI